jgi:S-formylglutathione hydrolase FrmB
VLLHIGVGRADGLAEFEDNFAEMFDADGVEHTAFDLPDYGSDWNYWRLALQDLSRRLFVPDSHPR